MNDESMTRGRDAPYRAHLPQLTADRFPAPERRGSVSDAGRRGMVAHGLSSPGSVKLMRRQSIAGFVLTPLLASLGCSSVNHGDDQYRLIWATPGKDVMWIPTREHVAVAMLEAAATRPDDVVYDLGSGDGVIPILAARRFGARAVGIEYNPDLVALSQRNAARAGVTDRVALKRGDIFVEDFSEATVVTLYLGENLNLKLEPRLRRMKPGTRIVSNTFSLGSWVPDRTLELADGGRAFFWIVPAGIEGRWRFRGLPVREPVEVQIGQRGQFFDLRTGSVWAGVSTEGRLEGGRASFVLAPTAGVSFKLIGEFSGDRFDGRIKDQPGMMVTAERIR
jgi:precorrin-6B methylase 2